MTIEELESINPIHGQTWVNFGCGQKILRHWVNVDKFQENPKSQKELPQNFDLFFACHSLEHMPVYEAKELLKEVHLKMNREGKIFISVPDTEEICKNFHLDPNAFIFCLYGLQTGPGQIHMWGYTEKTLFNLVREYFYVRELRKEMYGFTPSLWLEARKI